MRLGSQRGGSLIETLMTIGFFGVFAAGFSSMSVTQMKAISSMELKSDLAVLKTTIAGNIDCRRTSRAVCSGKPYVYTRTTKMRLPGARQIGGRVPMSDILEHASSPPKEVVVAKPRKPGAKPVKDKRYARENEKGVEPVWQVAAHCKRATRTSYDVYLYVARRNRPDGRFMRDPLTDQPWTWRDLFDGPVCQGFTK